MWLNPVYNEPLEDAYARILRRIERNGTKMVVHHETCPTCGRKLVNLYGRKNDISGKRDWRCKACWDKYDAAPPEKTKISGTIESALGGRFTDISTIDPNILIGKPIIRKVGNANVAVGTITEIDIERGVWYGEIEVRMAGEERLSDTSVPD